MLKTIQVLYEDEYFVAFNKPAGLLVVPTPKKEKDTLTDLVNEHHPSAQQGRGRGGRPSEQRLYPCHRLDRETSGVILFAKGGKNRDLMMAEFKALRVRKRYLAFVGGRLKRPEGTIRQPVRDYHEFQATRIFRGKNSPGAGHPAETAYRVLEEKPGYSVVEVFPKTGRTHQIRIHFKFLGCPLLGERLYAKGKDSPVRFRRLALHALELSWRHPVTKAETTVSAPLAEDMKKFWDSHF